MLSAPAMQYYCSGPGSAAGYPRPPYYAAINSELPSPTFISSSQLQGSAPSLYPNNRSQTYYQPSVAPAKSSQSSEAAAAALVALQDQPILHPAEDSPVSADCKSHSPGIKMEKGSPVSSMTPPPSAAARNEPDSSSNIITTTPCTHGSSEHGCSSSLAFTPDQTSASPDFHGGRAHNFEEPHSASGQVTLQFETVSPYSSVYSQTAPHLRPLPAYSPTTSYLQPAVANYTAIRYPPGQSGAAVHIPAIPYGFSPLQRRDETFPRTNSCHICGKTYARQSTLKTHLRSHSGEKPYQCSFCQKSFTQAANLTAHLRTHSGEKPFKCPVCSRGFSQSSSVTTHMRTHSGDRPYKCTACGKGFADSSTLTKHYRTHTGEKPYQCKICDARFSQSGNLNRHMRTHRSHFQGSAMLGRPV